VAQILGFAGTWLTLNHSIRNAQITPNGANATAQDIQGINALMGEASDYIFMGIGVAVIGLLLVIIAATRYRYRANWFFWFLCIYGAAMIMSYMLPFGLFFLIYAIMKKNEFDLEPPPEPGTLVR